MKYVFAGDRQISCDILKFLIEKGYPPIALFVTDGSISSHAEELIEISGLTDQFVFRGKKRLKDENILKFLKVAAPHYIIGIHYPYIISKDLIDIPSVGFLNLHPAFLPYNKGWHTPSWTILDNTPYGATLHFMSEQLDEGDIIHQKKLNVSKIDTANSLYKKVLDLEKQVFFEAFHNLTSLSPPRIKQVHKGTSHSKKDLEQVRKLHLDEQTTAEDLLNKLRALTTNRSDELAYFFEKDRKIGVKIEFIEIN